MKPPEITYFIIEEVRSYISGSLILDYKEVEVFQSELAELLENKIKVYKKTTSYEVLTKL